MKRIRLPGVALAMCCATHALAQDRSALRGVVVSDAAAVPYAIVAIAGHRVFADNHGAFTFLDVAPGSVRLSVRQVGFAPLDTVVSGPPNVALRLALRRLPMRLPSIEVATGSNCVVGHDTVDQNSGALETILSQVFENARRFQLMADEYPFVYRMRRAASERNTHDETVWQAVDTIAVRSDQRWKYVPGGLFHPGLGAGGRPARVVQVPQLPDLADSTFDARHCFQYAGQTTLEGSAALLVEFQVQSPQLSFDVDGSVWLDAGSYQVRRIAVRVVPADGLPDALSIEVAADFREIQPNVLVPVRILTVSRVPGSGREPFRKQEEEQRLVGVHFLRPLEGLP